MINDKIDSLIANAMKDGDKTRLEVLRMIKTEFVKKEKSGQKVNDALEVSMLTKMVAQREDSIKQFKEAKREDLVQTENEQLIILKEYAPKEVSEDEVRFITEQMMGMYSESKGSDYVISMRDTKAILGMVQDVHPAANGKLISQIIQEQIKK